MQVCKSVVFVSRVLFSFHFISFFTILLLILVGGGGLIKIGLQHQTERIRCKGEKRTLLVCLFSIVKTFF